MLKSSDMGISKSEAEEMLDSLAKKVKESTKNPESARESLLRAGIIDSDGKLTKPYRATDSLTIQ